MSARKEGQGISRRDLVVRRPLELLFGSNRTIIGAGRVLEVVGKRPEVLDQVVDIGIQSVGRIASSLPSLDKNTESSPDVICPPSSVVFTNAFEYIQGMDGHKGVDARDNGLIMAESGFVGVEEVIEVAASAGGIGKHELVKLYRAANKPEKVREITNDPANNISLSPHFYAEGAEYIRRYEGDPTSDLKKAYELAVKGSWGYVQWQQIQVAVAHARAGSDKYAGLLDMVYENRRAKSDMHSMYWMVKSAAECGDFKRTWEYLQNPIVQGRLWLVGEEAGWEFIRQGRHKEAEVVAEYALTHGKNNVVGYYPGISGLTGTDWQVELHTILAVAQSKKSSLFGGLRLSALQNAINERGTGDWIDILQNNLAVAKARRLVGHRGVYGDVDAQLETVGAIPIPIDAYRHPASSLLAAYEKVINMQTEVGDAQAAYETFTQMDQKFPIGKDTEKYTRNKVRSTKAKVLVKIGRAQAKKEGKYH